MLSRRFVFLGLSAAAVFLRVSRAVSSPLPECESCGAAEAPKGLTSSATIAPSDEPGERLILEGTVFASDGVTPVPGVLVYAYNTNAAGTYPKRGNETGNGQRHGYIRGWAITDNQGRFAFRTVRPGPYPRRNQPPHIHMTVTPPGQPEYWIDEVEFEGDPLLTKEWRTRREGRGGRGVVTLSRGADGVLHARRDVILPPPGAH